jgi:hypothetical protein
MIKDFKNTIRSNYIKLFRSKFHSSIPDLAFSKKWEIEKINAAQINELTAPVFIGNEDLIEKPIVDTHMHIWDQYLVCIPNAKIKCGYVSLGSGNFISEGKLRDDYWKKHTWRLDPKFTLNKSNNKSLDGDVYYLDNVFSHHYGHHISDDLPRLMSVFNKLPTSTRFVVVEPFRDEKLMSLAALGVKRENIVVVNGGSEITCERLWYVNPLDDITWNQKNVFQARDLIVKHYASDIVDSPSSIYISRQNLSNKRIINETKIIPILEKHNINVIHPEKLSVTNQINIFKNAKLIIGAYGGGLINMMFSSNANVLELQDELYAHRDWHWKWASILQHKYYCMFGPLNNFKEHVKNYGNPSNRKGYLKTDFFIRPESLNRALEKIAY